MTLFALLFRREKKRRDARVESSLYIYRMLLAGDHRRGEHWLVLVVVVLVGAVGGVGGGSRVRTRLRNLVNDPGSPG